MRRTGATGSVGAEVFARLLLTYISSPPANPDFGDDAELRRFAHEILAPMVDRLH